MTWPSSDVDNTDVSSGTTPGAPAASRLKFKDLIDKFNQLRNHVSSLGQTLLGRTTPALMRADLGVAPRATRIDVASVAGIVNLTTSAPDTDDIRITGALAITGFTVAVGRVIRVTAGGAFTLTNNAAIVTNTGANITLAAGDTFSLRATAADVVEVLGSLQIPTATESTAGKVKLATAAKVQAGADASDAVTSAGLRTVLLGSGQTWQNMIAGRSLGVTYYNTTTKPISIVVGMTPSGSGGVLTLQIAGSELMFHQTYGTQSTVPVTAIIPPGVAYSCTGSGTLRAWFELRG